MHFNFCFSQSLQLLLFVITLLTATFTTTAVKAASFPCTDGTITITSGDFSTEDLILNTGGGVSGCVVRVSGITVRTIYIAQAMTGAGGSLEFKNIRCLWGEPRQSPSCIFSDKNLNGLTSIVIEDVHVGPATPGEAGPPTPSNQNPVAIVSFTGTALSASPLGLTVRRVSMVAHRIPNPYLIVGVYLKSVSGVSSITVSDVSMDVSNDPDAQADDAVVSALYIGTAVPYPMMQSILAEKLRLIANVGQTTGGNESEFTLVALNGGVTGVGSGGIVVRDSYGMVTVPAAQGIATCIAFVPNAVSRCDGGLLVDNVSFSCDVATLAEDELKSALVQFSGRSGNFGSFGILLNNSFHNATVGKADMANYEIALLRFQLHSSPRNADTLANTPKLAISNSHLVVDVAADSAKNSVGHNIHFVRLSNCFNNVSTVAFSDCSFSVTANVPQSDIGLTFFTVGQSNSGEMQGLKYLTVDRVRQRSHIKTVGGSVREAILHYVRDNAQTTAASSNDDDAVLISLNDVVLESMVDDIHDDVHRASLLSFNGNLWRLGTLEVNNSVVSVNVKSTGAPGGGTADQVTSNLVLDVNENCERVGVMRFHNITATANIEGHRDLAARLFRISDALIHVPVFSVTNSRLTVERAVVVPASASAGGSVLVEVLSAGNQANHNIANITLLTMSDVDVVIAGPVSTPRGSVRVCAVATGEKLQSLGTVRLERVRIHSPPSQNAPPAAFLSSGDSDVGVFFIFAFDMVNTVQQIIVSNSSISNIASTASNRFVAVALRSAEVKGISQVLLFEGVSVHVASCSGWRVSCTAALYFPAVPVNTEFMENVRSFVVRAAATTTTTTTSPVHNKVHLVCGERNATGSTSSIGGAYLCEASAVTLNFLRQSPSVVVNDTDVTVESSVSPASNTALSPTTVLASILFIAQSQGADIYVANSSVAAISLTGSPFVNMTSVGAVLLNGQVTNAAVIDVRNTIVRVENADFSSASASAGTIGGGMRIATVAFAGQAQSGIRNVNLTNCDIAISNLKFPLESARATAAASSLPLVTVAHLSFDERSISDAFRKAPLTGINKIDGTVTVKHSTVRVAQPISGSISSRIASLLLTPGNMSDSNNLNNNNEYVRVGGIDLDSVTIDVSLADTGTNPAATQHIEGVALQPPVNTACDAISVRGLAICVTASSTATAASDRVNDLSVRAVAIHALAPGDPNALSSVDISNVSIRDVTVWISLISNPPSPVVVPDSLRVFGFFSPQRALSRMQQFSIVNVSVSSSSSSSSLIGASKFLQLAAVQLLQVELAGGAPRPLLNLFDISVHSIVLGGTLPLSQQQQQQQSQVRIVGVWFTGAGIVNGLSRSLDILRVFVDIAISQSAAEMMPVSSAPQLLLLAAVCVDGQLLQAGRINVTSPSVVLKSPPAATSPILLHLPSVRLRAVSLHSTLQLGQGGLLWVENAKIAFGGSHPLLTLQSTDDTSFNLGTKLELAVVAFDGGALMTAAGVTATSSTPAVAVQTSTVDVQLADGSARRTQTALATSTSASNTVSAQILDSGVASGGGGVTCDATLKLMLVSNDVRFMNLEQGPSAVSSAAASRISTVSLICNSKLQAPSITLLANTIRQLLAPKQPRSVASILLLNRSACANQLTVTAFGNTIAPAWPANPAVLASASSSDVAPARRTLCNVLSFAGITATSSSSSGIAGKFLLLGNKIYSSGDPKTAWITCGGGGDTALVALDSASGFSQTAGAAGCWFQIKSNALSFRDAAILSDSTTGVSSAASLVNPPIFNLRSSTWKIGCNQFANQIALDFVEAHRSTSSNVEFDCLKTPTVTKSKEQTPPPSTTSTSGAATSTSTAAAANNTTDVTTNSSSNPIDTTTTAITGPNTTTSANSSSSFTNTTTTTAVTTSATTQKPPHPPRSRSRSSSITRSIRVNDAAARRLSITPEAGRATIAVGAALLSMIGGGAHAASAHGFSISSKVYSLATIGKCAPPASDEEAEASISPLSFDTNPLMFEIGDDAFATHRGAMLGNSVLLAGLLLFIVVGCAMWSRVSPEEQQQQQQQQNRNNNSEKEADKKKQKKSSNSNNNNSGNKEKEKEDKKSRFQQLLLTARFPGITGPLVQTFGPPTIGNTVTLLAGPVVLFSNAERRAADVVFALLGVIVFFAVPSGIFVYSIWRCRNFEVLEDAPPVRKLTPLELHRETLWRKVVRKYKWLVDGFKVWRESDFVIRWTQYFDAYQGPGAIAVDYYTVATLCSLAASSALCQNDSCCEGVSIAALILVVLYCGFIFYYRPYVARFEILCGFPGCALALVGASMAVAATFSRDHDYDEDNTFVAVGDVMAVLGMALGFCVILKGVLDVVTTLHDWLCSSDDDNDDKKQGADDDEKNKKKRDSKSKNSKGDDGEKKTKKNKNGNNTVIDADLIQQQEEPLLDRTNSVQEQRRQRSSSSSSKQQQQLRRQLPPPSAAPSSSLSLEEQATPVPLATPPPPPQPLTRNALKAINVAAEREALATRTMLVEQLRAARVQEQQRRLQEQERVVREQRRVEQAKRDEELLKRREEQKQLLATFEQQMEAALTSTSSSSRRGSKAPRKSNSEREKKVVDKYSDI